MPDANGILTDEDTAYVTPNGKEISVGVLKRCCFSNVDQQNINDNIELLLKAQHEATLSHLAQGDEELRLNPNERVNVFEKWKSQNPEIAEENECEASYLFAMLDAQVVKAISILSARYEKKLQEAVEKGKLLLSMLADKEVAITDLKSLLQMWENGVKEGVWVRKEAVEQARVEERNRILAIIDRCKTDWMDDTWVQAVSFSPEDWQALKGEQPKEVK